MNIDLTNVQVGPFLRWTGSKRWFVNKYIEEFLPSTFNNYHEPFVGAGSVFFYLINCNKSVEREYFLSDTNKDLINTYLQLKENPSLVIKHLKSFKNNEEEYYKVRKTNPKSPAKKAARLIYLNKTSFNGIYRVNSKGVYNVPYGKRQKVEIVNEQHLLNISNRLNGIHINSHSFEENLKNIKEKDLVFLDPPYTVAHENNGFIEYNKNLFSWEDQEKLKAYIEKIIAVGAYFILTNASHTSILNLYQNIGTIRKLSRYSQVGGRNKTRGMYNELIIYNTR